MKIGRVCVKAFVHLSGIIISCALQMYVHAAMTVVKAVIMNLSMSLERKCNVYSFLDYKYIKNYFVSEY